MELIFISKEPSNTLNVNNGLIYLKNSIVKELDLKEFDRVGIAIEKKSSGINEFYMYKILGKEGLEVRKYRTQHIISIRQVFRYIGWPMTKTKVSWERFNKEKFKGVKITRI